jgi:hypothetical protein
LVEEARSAVDAVPVLVDLELDLDAAVLAGQLPA